MNASTYRSTTIAGCCFRRSASRSDRPRPNDLQVPHASQTPASEDRAVTRTAPVAYVRLMARCLGALLVAAAVLASVACGTQHAAQRDPSVHVAPDLPPAAATWPPYPHFSDASCWTRPFGGGTPLRAAPSVPVAALPSHLAAAMIVARLLARFGDHRYVRSVSLGPPPRSRCSTFAATSPVHAHRPMLCGRT